MRIRHYPGRAVDATLSLDQRSPMENIYKNNWLNADKTIKTIGRNSSAVQRMSRNNNDDATFRQNDSRSLNPIPSSGSSGPQSGSSDEENRRNSISSLGRYQVTLEEMQKLDLNQSNELFRKTMRNLNGYKPSTIRQKHRRFYDGWDDFRENDKIDDKHSSSDYNNKTGFGNGNNDSTNGDWQLNGYKYPDSLQNDNQVFSIPKIKRSQTVRYASTNGNGGKSTNLNIRNVFQQSQPQPQTHTQQAQLSHEKNDEGINKMATATINKNFNNRFKRSNLRSIQNASIDENEISANSGDLNSLIQLNDSKSNGNDQKPNGNCDNEPVQQEQNKSAKRPLFRAKSVRINPTPLQNIYFDEFNGSNRDKQEQHNINGYGSPVNGHPPKLPRLTSIMKKKPTVIPEKQQHEEEQQHQQQQPSHHTKPILFQWVDNQRKKRQQQQQQQNSKKDEKHSSISSLSSTSSSCNSNSDFSIPRPRLIVPVHTYARKRRTGNLIQSQAGDQVEDAGVVVEQPRNNKNNNRKNGKCLSFFICPKSLKLIDHNFLNLKTDSFGRFHFSNMAIGYPWNAVFGH